MRQKAVSYIDECIEKYSNKNKFEYKQYEIDKDYYTMHHLILPELLLYKVKYKNKPLTFVTQNMPINFIIPEEIIEDTDYIFSYGIGDRMYWEEMISKYYKKPTYAFDCGVRFKDSDTKSEYLTFCSECIGTDEHISKGQVSSGKIHTLESKINELGLQNKKIYLRFGIPELQRFIPDVLNSTDNIIGISFLTDFTNPAYIVKIKEMLELLNKDFVLVSRNFLYTRDERLNNGKIKYTAGKWSIMLDLTYVNKSVLDEYYIPLNQTNYENGKPKSYISFHLESYRKKGILKNVIKSDGKTGYYKENNISPIVVIHQRIKNILEKDK